VGAVQKLATIVVVGLTALATLLVVYVANEPNRTEQRATQHQEAAIRRGIQTYIQQCVACHGPGGEGAVAGDGRIGAPLNPHAGNPEPRAEDEDPDYRDNQSEDPAIREQRYDTIVNVLHNGRGLMPAFGRGAPGGPLLNDEQIHELATMITLADWDRVYNETIAHYDRVYPTAPPPAGADAATGAGGQGGEAAPAPPGGGQVGGAEGQEGVFTIEGFDIGWRYQGQETAPGAPIDVTVPPGANLSLPNVGAAMHNFSVDELGIDVDMPPGETVSALIPADAAPGTYRFYCDVPGHPEAGMVGNLIIDPNAPVPGREAAAAPAAEGAAPAAGAAPPAGGQPLTIEAFDIGWRHDGQETAPGAPIEVAAAPGATINLPNAGAAMHNFSVDALGIDVDMAPGETATVTLPADAAPGTYEFYCNVPGHKQAGQVGTLIIQ